MSSFFAWLRRTSEHYLMIDAQDKVAQRLGVLRPRPPHGFDLFWRRIYVPIFYLLPEGLRNGMIARMPGSHRQPWPVEPELKGPAI